MMHASAAPSSVKVLARKYLRFNLQLVANILTESANASDVDASLCEGAEARLCLKLHETPVILEASQPHTSLLMLAGW